MHGMTWRDAWQDLAAVFPWEVVTDLTAGQGGEGVAEVQLLKNLRLLRVLRLLKLLRLQA